MKEKISGIYCITNKINGKFYIGQDSDIGRQSRWRRHIYNLNNKTDHANRHLQRAWNKYGEDAFEYKIIEYVLPENLNMIEQWYLDHTDCLNREYGYNIEPKVDKSICSKETRKKMSIAAKNRPHPKGFKRTPEQNLANSIRMKKQWQDRSYHKHMSDIHKGQIQTEEAKKKNSIANSGKNNGFYGKHHSEETKQKIRDTIARKRAQNG